MNNKTTSKTNTYLLFCHKPSGKFLYFGGSEALLVEYRDERTISSFRRDERASMRLILKWYADRQTLPKGTKESEYEIVREKVTTVVIREIVPKTSKSSKKETKR